MKLSGQQSKKLQKALIDAFPDKSSLEQMLWFELDKNLDLIAAEKDNLEVIIFKLIKKAVKENWIENLIYAVCKARPINISLKAIAKLLGLDESIQMLDVNSNETIDVNLCYEKDNNQIMNSKLPEPYDIKTEGVNYNERVGEHNIQADTLKISEQEVKDKTQTVETSEPLNSINIVGNNSKAKIGDSNINIGQARDINLNI